MSKVTHVFHPEMGGCFICGEVAQLVEQRTENPRVAGPIPALATIFVP